MLGFWGYIMKHAAYKKVNRADRARKKQREKGQDKHA